MDANAVPGPPPLLVDRYRPVRPKKPPMRSSTGPTASAFPSACSPAISCVGFNGRCSGVGGCCAGVAATVPLAGDVGCGGVLERSCAATTGEHTLQNNDNIP